jgi:hypothetical protein
MPALSVARQAFVTLLVAVLAILSLGSPVSALSGVRSYDIQAQTLVAALAEFADQAGMAALVDAEVARDKTSSMVKGRLVPQDALRILLAGTGLSFRRVNDAAFAVGPNTSEPAADGLSESRGNGAYDGYFARIQDQTERSLCKSPRIHVDGGRGVVQVWVGAAGAVDAVHVVTPLDVERRVALSERIMRIRVAPPPAGLPQPLTMILRNEMPGGHCPGGPATTP